MSDDDFQIVRKKLEDEALSVMERIDQLEKELKKKPASGSADIA